MAGALALVAAGISAYLVTVHYSGGPIACFAGGSCETVQKSAYSQIGSVPLSVLGLAAYVALALSFVWRGENGATASLGLSVATAIFATYLIVVQAVVIDAICAWCMTTDAIAMTVLVLSVLRLRAEVRLADTRAVQPPGPTPASGLDVPGPQAPGPQAPALG